MEASACEKDGRLNYQIKNHSADLDKVLLHNGYVKTDDGFTKSFPLNFPYRDKIVQNFLRNAEAMFHEEASIKPMNWREGFLHFASIAKEANLDW